MSDLDIEILLKKDTELLYDKTFIQRIFKRTERACSAVFYITNKIEHKEKDTKDTYATEIKDILYTILDTASSVLVLDTPQARSKLTALSASLMHLSALMELGKASQRIEESHALLMGHEITSLLSEIAEFRVREVKELPRIKSKLVRERTLISVPTDSSLSRGAAGDGEGAASKTTPVLTENRKDRIKDILRDKGQSGIKDISDIIKDVSEKSIQRDLNDLIESGDVVRLGERRWSTYKLL